MSKAQQGHLSKRAQLTRVEACSIKKMLAEGAKTDVIARRFNVSVHTITGILRGHSYANAKVSNGIQALLETRRGAAKGELCGRARLTDCSVKEIKIRLDAGWKCAHLAEEFGVTNGTVECIARGKTWSSVSITDEDKLATVPTALAKRHPKVKKSYYGIETARQIKALALQAKRPSDTEIARRFNVSRTMVRLIRIGQRWPEI